KHVPEVRDVTVNKVWDDAGDQDGKRPGSIEVQLYADGEAKGDPVSVTGDNWTYTWTGLDAKAAGDDIVYTVDEVNVPEGYEKSVNGMTITNTHKPAIVNFNGTKTWDDKENQDGIRPNSITIRLLAGGEEVNSTTVTEDNGWKYEFNNLPQFNAGSEIEYTITEDAVENYSTKIEDFNVTNTYTPKQTSVTVTKAWDDAGDQDGKRPDGVSVQLYADGKALGDPIMLSEKTGWTYTWSNLDMMKAGEAIVYTVDELEVPEGYTKAITGDQKEGFVITNSYTPETTDLTVYKKWKDKNDKYGERPYGIIVYLQANGEDVQTIKITEDDNWRYTFTDLPVYEDGEKIIYSLYEEPVGGYITEIEDMTITNTIDPEEFDDNADTGDDSNPWAHGFVGLMAIITAAGALFFRRRKA
ncbi:MAG: Cna B-type domain-containing protein, partial [Bacillota bacterium]|nr:Cna B-type domain-containing protein [Bacillota bacterium]